MFNHRTPSFTDMTKRLSAINILPQLKDAVAAISEENMKEIHRILKNLSAIEALPASIAAIELDHALLCDENRFFDAFKSLHFVASFLTHDDTTAIIRKELITRYPFNMKNVLFIRLSEAANVPESYLDLLCFYFERDYQHEFGQGKRNQFTCRTVEKHENITG